MQWKHLLTTRNDIEASLVEGVLAGADIPVAKVKSALGVLLTAVMGPNVEVKLMVPADRYEEAKSLLEELELPEPDEAD